MSEPTTRLSAQGLCVRYGKNDAVKRLDLEMRKGEFVALLGSNGAGKSTTLRAIAGLIPARSGSIAVNGTEISGWPAHRVGREAGVALVPEGRRLFTDQSVDSNLRLGAFRLRKDPDRVDELLGFVYELFPDLASMRNRLCGSMSGGQQQMAAIGRALMADPQVLLLDEPSLGLAPKVTASVFEALKRLRAEGRTVLLVEQTVRHSLEVCDRAYVLQAGEIVVSGPSAEVAISDELQSAYL